MNFEKNFNFENNNQEKEKEKDWQEKVREYYAGEMHSHTLRSSVDAKHGFKEKKVHSDSRLMQYGEKLGLDFVFFSEHTSDPGNPTRLEVDDPVCESILAQQKEIDKLNDSHKYDIKAYNAVEANIMFNEQGEAMIDVPDEVLKELDLVIASRHRIENKFEPEKIRESLLTAIYNPHVDVIGHPYRRIEFYQHDWRYFKKYYQENEEISKELNELEKNNDWDSIKQIIGKQEAQSDATKKYNKMFNELKSSYWQVWDEIFSKVEENGKALEINLPSFDPGKEFYITFLEKASKYSDLKFNIAYDFHNLGQMEEFDNRNYKNDAPLDIKNPDRAKGVQRLLELISLFKKFEIEPERIINSSKENMEKFLESRNSKK